MSTPALCILYVDDDENDVVLLQFASEAAGMKDCFRTVTSGPQAMEYLQGYGPFADRSRFPLPDILLLDLRMPRMNGFELLQWVRSQPHLLGTVTIFFTASAHPDDVVRACELGANAFVQKPSTQAELIRFLRSLKAFWGEFHELPSTRVRPVLAELPKPELTP